MKEFLKKYKIVFLFLFLNIFLFLVIVFLLKDCIFAKKQKVENTCEAEKITEVKKDKEIKCFGYCRIEDEIYFYDKIVDGVDIESFSVSGGFSSLNYFVFDDNSVYYRGKKLNFDYSTFMILNSFFVKDENGVYFIDEFEKIDLDTNRVVALNDNYIKDDNYVYYAKFGPAGFGFVKIEGIDAKTFNIFTDKNGNIFVEDKNGIYYGVWLNDDYRLYKINELKRESLKYSGFYYESNYLRDDSNCFKYEKYANNTPKKVNMSECVKVESEM